MESGVEISGDVKDRIIKEAYERIQSYEAQGVPSQQIMDEIRARLVEQEEVEEIRMAYGTDLTVRFADGTQVGILLGRKRAYGMARVGGGPQELKGGHTAQKSEDRSE